MIGMYAFAYPNMIVEHYTAERIYLVRYLVWTMQL